MLLYAIGAAPKSAPRFVCCQQCVAEQAIHCRPLRPEPTNPDDKEPPDDSKSQEHLLDEMVKSLKEFLQEVS